MEDEYKSRQSLQLILAQAGYSVKTLQSPSEVLDILGKAHSDVVILRLHNSDQNGLSPSLNGSKGTSTYRPRYGGSLNEE